MDEQKKIIISTISEFLESAKEDEEKKRIKSALTMYFKVIAELSDFLIYDQILKVPSNHTERYDLLKQFFPEIFKRTSPLFRIYRKTYSQVVEKYDLEKVKNEALKLIKETEVGKHLQEVSEERGS